MFRGGGDGGGEEVDYVFVCVCAGGRYLACSG